MYYTYIIYAYYNGRYSLERSTHVKSPPLRYYYIITVVIVVAVVVVVVVAVLLSRELFIRRV